MYTIKFSDGELFLGGNPEDSNWNSMPNKVIAELHYDLLGKKIKLSGYEAYNHLIECPYIIPLQRQVITVIIIMAKKDNNVYRFIYDLIKNKLITDEVLYRQEYKNKPTSGWKAGLSNTKSEFKID
jgi:hypothetical protein